MVSLKTGVVTLIPEQIINVLRRRKVKPGQTDFMDQNAEMPHWEES